MIQMTGHRLRSLILMAVYFTGFERNWCFNNCEFRSSWPHNIYEFKVTGVLILTCWSIKYVILNFKDKADVIYSFFFSS